MVKVLFFGTPEISVRFLEKIAQKHKVVGVITKKDMPAKRGWKICYSPVKIFALNNNIPIFQPDVFDFGLIEQLKAISPDVGVVVSYGKLIPKGVYSIPLYGCFNIHFSILPKYRGAAPVQWAIINGEKQTGVTTFWLEESLDSGPIIVQKIIEIDKDDDTESLFKKIIPVGIQAMEETFERISLGKCAGTPQVGIATYAPSLSKDDGNINWSKTSIDIINLIRGAKPWPCAYSHIIEGKSAGMYIKILKARQSQDKEELKKNYIPGQVCGFIKNIGFEVATGDLPILIEEVHPESSKKMTSWEFWLSGKLNIGDKIG